MADVRGDMLYSELVAAGLPVVGVSVPPEQHKTVDPATWETKGATLVRIDWSVVPTPGPGGQIEQSQSVLAAHNGNQKPPFDALNEKIRSKTASASEVTDFLAKMAGRA